jgi:probable phosphoglycerate mutase
MEERRVFLIRHGETAWTLTGKHTGRTDIPLTETGRAIARQLSRVLRKVSFAKVLVSPLSRAKETYELAGLCQQAEIDCDVMEWDYGEYEGLTSTEIRAKAPEWMLFTDGAPGGETPEQMGTRVDRVIAKVRLVQGNVAVFAHGHFCRVFAVRWIGLPVADAAHFLLDTASVSVLSHYQGVPAVKCWNAVVKLPTQ